MKTPTVTSITPATGVAGDSVKIAGKNFEDGNNIQGIFFGGVAATDWHVNSDTEIVDVEVPVLNPPASPGDIVDVVVRTEGGVANFGNGAVESAPVDFTYTA